MALSHLFLLPPTCSKRSQPFLTRLSSRTGETNPEYTRKQSSGGRGEGLTAKGFPGNFLTDGSLLYLDGGGSWSLDCASNMEAFYCFKLYSKINLYLSREEDQYPTGPPTGCFLLPPHHTGPASPASPGCMTRSALLLTENGILTVLSDQDPLSLPAAWMSGPSTQHADSRLSFKLQLKSQILPGAVPGPSGSGAPACTPLVKH